MSTGDLYTSHQIDQIFTHVSLPLPPNDLSSLSAQPLLSFLTQLQQHALASIPFENLSIHYSTHHTISLHPQDLYRKIIGDAGKEGDDAEKGTRAGKGRRRSRGRGGYCMENNAFLLTLLRSLGLKEVYAVGARVAMEADGSGIGFGGWSHMVIMVALPAEGAGGAGAGGGKVVMDIGFGSTGPTCPLRVVDGDLVESIQPARMRLVRDWIPEQSHRVEGSKVWVYQHQKRPGEEWATQYMFVDVEFIGRDFEIENFWTSASRQSFFTQRVVVAKMVMKGEELIWQLTLDAGVVKRRVGGEMQVLVDCKSEEERVKALKKDFGIVLTEQEIRGIKGLVSELKG